MALRYIGKISVRSNHFSAIERLTIGGIDFSDFLGQRIFSWRKVIMERALLDRKSNPLEVIGCSTTPVNDSDAIFGNFFAFVLLSDFDLLTPRALGILCRGLASLGRYCCAIFEEEFQIYHKLTSLDFKRTGTLFSSRLLIELVGFSHRGVKANPTDWRRCCPGGHRKCWREAAQTYDKLIRRSSHQP